MLTTPNGEILVSDKNEMSKEEMAERLTAKSSETVEDQQKKLDRVEAKEVRGAPSLQPKASMLDASALQKKNPEKYYRYGSMANRDKMEERIASGEYTLTDEKEARKAGVRARLGDRMALIETSKEHHDQKMAAAKKEHERRLEAHKSEVRQVAEGVARELRDKHGLDVDVDRILVDR